MIGDTSSFDVFTFPLFEKSILSGYLIFSFILKMCPLTPDPSKLNSVSNIIFFLAFHFGIFPLERR